VTLSLEQALAELPDTAGGIAAYLIEQECRGRREDGARCPIANYLRGTGEFNYPFVDHAVVYSDERYSVPTPQHVSAFVDRFDAGEWPELDIDQDPEES
jgi:hypothetical protein